MTPFSAFNDEPEEPKSEPEDDERELSEHEDFWLASVLARQAEQAGLIHKSDDFSCDWHMRYGDDFEAAKAEAAEAGSGEAADFSPSPSSEPGEPKSNVGPDLGVEFGTGFSTLGSFGADFGAF